MQELVTEVQRLYPQIYLACHVDHVRAPSTKWDLSSHDSSILAHLDREHAMTPRDLAAHLGVAASTLSASIARLSRLGYLSSTPLSKDRRQRELRLTARGAEAMSSTSVLDRERVRKMLEQLEAREQKAAVRGLSLLASAARKLERKSR